MQSNLAAAGVGEVSVDRLQESLGLCLSVASLVVQDESLDKG
jgi:hypothetical protein